MTSFGRVFFQQGLRKASALPILCQSKPTRAVFSIFKYGASVRHVAAFSRGCKLLSRDKGSYRISASYSTAPEAPPLVSTSWLKTNFHDKIKQSNISLIDATWIPGTHDNAGGHDAFEEKHILEAQQFDLLASKTNTQILPKDVPDPQEFQLHAQSLGINNDSHVVVYDRDDGNDLWSLAAPRAWWLFRLFGHRNVSVLDGGLLKWEADGYPVASEWDGLPNLLIGNFTSQIDPTLRLTFEEMRDLVAQEKIQVVDTRLPKDYDGSVEPSPFTKLILEETKFPPLIAGSMRGGHMHGSLNVPFPVLFHKDSIHWREKDELQQIFSDAGVNMAKPVVGTCYIGYSACLVPMVMKILGHDQMAVYSGSWTEWGQRASADMCKVSKKN